MVVFCCLRKANIGDMETAGDVGALQTAYPECRGYCSKRQNNMRKLIYAGVLLLTLMTVELHAQTFADRLHFEFTAGAGVKNNGVTPVDLSFKSHVDFVSASYLFVTVEDNISLYNANGTKTYYKSVGIGGGAGLKLLDRSTGIHALDIRAKALGSVGRPAWRRTSYDLCLAWYLKAWKFSPVVELGYRFVDSRTAGFDNYGSVYISIGFRY